MSRRLVVTVLVVPVLLITAFLSRTREAPAQTNVVPPVRCIGAPLPDVLQVARTSDSYPADSLSNASHLQRTVRDRALVRQLFTTVCTLPTFPRGVMSCRRDLGVLYDLDFRRDKTQVTHAVAHASGCEQVLIESATGPYGATQQFWSLLAMAIREPGAWQEPDGHASAPPKHR